MKADEKIIDQTKLAQSLSEQIPYEFSRYFLVKPLEPVMVTKEFSTPVVKEETTTEDGLEVKDYDDVTTETKEVESDFTRGVVLKVPVEATAPKDEKFTQLDIKLGDIVVYKGRYAQYFDLLKDSQLISRMDILCKMNTSDAE